MRSNKQNRIAFIDSAHAILVPTDIGDYSFDLTDPWFMLKAENAGASPARIFRDWSVRAIGQAPLTLAESQEQERIDPSTNHWERLSIVVPRTQTFRVHMVHFDAEESESLFKGAYITVYGQIDYVDRISPNVPTWVRYCFYSAPYGKRPSDRFWYQCTWGNYQEGDP